MKISSNTFKIANTSPIQGDVYVETAGGQTLQEANIKGNLIFADGIKKIGDWFMGRAIIDGDVVIPASVTNIGAWNWITLLDSLKEGHKVYCGAGNCYELFYKSCYKDTREGWFAECLSALKSLNDNGKLAGYNDECTDYKCQSCKSDYNYIKSGTGCVSDCGTGYLGKDGVCISSANGCGAGYQLEGNVCEKLQENCSEAFEKVCSKCNNGYLEKDGICISSANGCGAGYKDMGGFCNRIQYTPAEAAALLKDDNTNSVVITFKK